MIVTVAASARVLIERAQGLVHVGSDLFDYYVPSFAWWWHSPRWLGGWNPWIFGGCPANADPEIGQLNPLGLLYVLFVPLTAATVEGAVAPALAGCGMLLYLRQIDCGRVARLIGATSFALGGFVAAHAPHASVVRTVLALPWALAAIEGLSGSALVAGLGAATGLLLLGGHPQAMLYALVLIALYALLLGRPIVERRALHLALGILLGIGVAAGTWLPALELVFSSTRSLGLPPAMAIAPLAPHELDRLFAPFSQGRSVGMLYGSSLGIPFWLLTETTGYPGLLVWLLVLAALPRLLRDRHGRFWLSVALVGLAAVTGLTSIVLPLPGMRAPGRLMMWWSIAMAALVAVALRERPRWPSCAIATALVAAVIAWSAVPGHAALRAALGSTIVLGVAVAALCAASAGRRRTGWLVVAIVADLVAFDLSLPLAIERAQLAYARRDVEQLREAVMSVAPPGETPPRSALTPRLAGANWAPLAQTPVLQGFSSLVPRKIAFLLGHVPDSIAEAELGGLSDPSLASPSSHVLDLLRTSLIVVDVRRSVPDPLGEAIHAAARSGASRWQRLPLAARRDFDFYLNKRVRPVAWLVGRVRVMAPDLALRSVRGTLPGERFDPSVEALSEAPIPGIRDGATISHDANRPAERQEIGVVGVGSYLEDEVRLASEAPDTALLVTSDLAYPGWSVEVDGLAATLHDVNAGFRAVVVPPGRHEVRFAYRPALAPIGLSVSALSTFLVLAFATREALLARTRFTPRSRSSPGSAADRCPAREPAHTRTPGAGAESSSGSGSRPAGSAAPGGSRQRASAGARRRDG
jgi:hypothetical protein